MEISPMYFENLDLHKLGSVFAAQNFFNGLKFTFFNHKQETFFNNFYYN